jgi:hypothetical protein
MENYNDNMKYSKIANKYNEKDIFFQSKISFINSIKN